MQVSWRARTEIGLLVALCIFLPLYEAPKNLVWLGYVLAWLANRSLERDFGGRWDGWDTLIALWLVSGFVVAAFAGQHGSEWRAPLDTVRNGAVLWMVKRSRMDAREIEIVLAALVGATLIGLAMAYAKLWSGDASALSLNSVGHVNHTAIYLAIMLGLCAAWLFSGERPVLAAAITLLMLVSVSVTASRAGVGVALFTVVFLAAAWWRRSRLPLLVALSVVALSLFVALIGGAEVFEKHEALVNAGNTLAFRDEVWRFAVSAWLEHPWFGVGIDNFGLAVDPAKRAFYPHAHSLYLNALAERGVIGSLPLFALLGAWSVSLWRRWPRVAAPALDWVLWGAAASALLVTAAVGLVNTTLHHEHGLLAVLLLAVWLATQSDRR